MWTASSAISLGSGNTGLVSTLLFALARGATIDPSLRDLAYDATGVTLVERGAGIYWWQYTAMPDDFVGDVVFYVGTVGAGSDFSGVAVKGTLDSNFVAATDGEVTTNNPAVQRNVSVTP